MRRIGFPSPRSILLLGTAFVALAPAASRAQSLTEALASAYTNNAQLQAERAVLRQTDEAVPQALANWRPTVSISASEGYQHDALRQECSADPAACISDVSTTGTVIGKLPGSLSSVEELSPQTYGVQLTQPIFRGGRTVAQTEQAESQVRAERAHLLSVEQTVLLTAVTDYMSVFAAQSVVDLNFKNEAVLKRQLEATQDRFRVGEVTRTDVAQAEAAYAGAIAGRQSAQGSLQVARATYTHDIGPVPEKVTEPKEHPTLPASRQEATDQALAQNPNVTSADFGKAAAEKNVDVIAGQLLPQISMTASVIRATETASVGLRTDSMSVTGQLTMPLYEGGAVYSATRQAKEAVAQQQSLLDDARRASVQSGASAWEQLQSSRATIVSLESQIHANEIALDGVQQEAAVGSRTVLDILNAEQILFQSRVNLVQAQQTEVIAEYTLASAIGRLTAKDLSLPVELYDPVVHYDAVHDKWFGFGSSDD